MILSVRYTPVVGFVRRESVLQVLNIVVIRLHGKVAPLGGKVLIVTTPDTFDAVNPGGSQRRSPRLVTVEDISVEDFGPLAWYEPWLLVDGGQLGVLGRLLHALVEGGVVDSGVYAGLQEKQNLRNINRKVNGTV
jgi:hypothetical protein